VTPVPDSLHLSFTQDYHAGVRDASGQWMGGTETMCLLAHGGKLFASVGYWSDLEPGNDPKPGAQMLRKDSASGAWHVDFNFGASYLRVEAMRDVAITTDGAGKRLASPVTLLMAGLSDLRLDSKGTAVAIRNDASNGWDVSDIVPAEGPPAAGSGDKSDVATSEIRALGRGVRSFGDHVDRKTRVHCLFAGSAKGRIYTGVYDPSLATPGHLRWDAKPELEGTGRVMCFEECDGVLYAACGIRRGAPETGGVFRRIDGAKPAWERVYHWPFASKKEVVGDEMTIMRGLHAERDPADGHEFLIGTRAGAGVIERIDPKHDNAVATELDLKAYFAKAFGVKEISGLILSAYNWPTPFTCPTTGENVTLIGVLAGRPNWKTPPTNGSVFLVRRANGKYEWGNVFDPSHPVPQGQQLRATRSICLSPFPEDHGRVLYFGGFDAFAPPHHNTAWIYRAACPG
jgi:hypothetical protein